MKLIKKEKLIMLLSIFGDYFAVWMSNVFNENKVLTVIATK